MPNYLQVFDAARLALTKATKVDEVKKVRDQAEALRLYLRQQSESLEMQNQCAEIKLRAERRAGELLDEREKNKGGGDRRSDHPLHGATGDTPTLAELGVERTQAHRWQRIAAMPEGRFERVIADTKTAKEELTTARMLRAASGDSVHFRSGSAEWYTPESIIERVLAVLGSIDLDPCSDTGDRPNIPAARAMTTADDGLSVPWAGKVYMNPPYGNTIGDWVDHLASDYEQGAVDEAIALLPARTDTAWCHRLRAYPRCFILGRLHFSGHETGAPFPSMAVYLGPDTERFVTAFSDVGDCYGLLA